jgi:hypothetical protein
MPKKDKATRGESGTPEEFDDQASAVADEIIEFDESKPSTQGLAEVQTITEDAGLVSVPEAMFEACQELELRMGGAESTVAALSAPSDDSIAGPVNIVGWGVGEKVVGGRSTGELALKVYVAEKVAASEVQTQCLVPESIRGFQTDVEEVGDVNALRFTGRHRPAPGGSSVGHPRITAGTLGCLVVRNNNRLCILSNNHVLANSNDARVGDAILQPGPADGGRNPQDRVGALEAFVPITFGAAGANEVDGALAWTAFRNVSPRHHCYRINPQPVNPQLFLPVRKCGRTTQATLGLVVGLGVTIRVNFGTSGVALFRNQIEIRGIGGTFSAGGDSGSVVVTAGTLQPVGLLFAGGGNLTFANRIGSVVSALGIRRFLN